MGKIISKVRQREFNAMLYRRALERNECSAYSRAIPGAGASWSTGFQEQAAMMYAEHTFQSMPLLLNGWQSR